MPNIELNMEAKGLTLTRAGTCDGARHITLPALFMRERVRSAELFDATNHQRLYEHADLPLDLEITHAELSFEKISSEQIPPKQILSITFSDGLCSSMPFDEILREIGWQENPETPPAAIAWDSARWLEEISPSLGDLSWKALDSPEIMKRCLEIYFKYGFTIIQGTDTHRDSLKSIARRFGFLRETNFGELFNVETKVDPSDLAYTDSFLAAHTDNPYRQPVPSIQFLHCLANDVEGGLSTLADGIAIVEALEAEAPEQARALETTLVRFRYQGPAGILEDVAPVIARNASGRVSRIRLSSRVDYVLPYDSATLDLFYAGRRRLNRLANDPAFQISFPFRPGTLLMMDNYRLTHGRTAFDGSTGYRHLQGCYIDHDGPDCLYRVLVNDGVTTHVTRDAAY